MTLRSSAPPEVLSHTSEESKRGADSDAHARFLGFPPKASLRALMIAGAFAITLTFLHIGALAGAWYWRFWWFDGVMHFLGGATVGLVIAWGWRYIPWGPHHWFGWSLRQSVAIGLGFAMLVWEAGEYFAGIALQTEAAWEPYPLDTAIDVALGALGGWCVVRLWETFQGEKRGYPNRPRAL